MDVNERDMIAAINELADRHGLLITEQRQPGWVDSYQMGEHWGVNHKVAYARLRDMEELGHLESKIVREGRRTKIRVWRAVGGKAELPG